jgi:hypothetical protein
MQAWPVCSHSMGILCRKTLWCVSSAALPNARMHACMQGSAIVSWGAEAANQVFGMWRQHRGTGRRTDELGLGRAAHVSWTRLALRQLAAWAALNQCMVRTGCACSGGAHAWIEVQMLSTAARCAGDIPVHAVQVIIQSDNVAAEQQACRACNKIPRHAQVHRWWTQIHGRSASSEG